MPTMPITKPIVSAIRPRLIERPISELTVTKAKSIRAKKSGGVILRPRAAMLGAAIAKIPVPIAPAKKEPMAAVAKAAPAFPALAILFPSMAVITEPDSPGAFKRMEVVEPPNIAP